MSDWLLVHDGRGIGGFTIPHVWESLSPEEQAGVKDESPFCYFNYRNNAAAEEQLISIPVCPKCNRRSLEHIFDFDPQPECGYCRNGSRRCDCPKCGAPLIRNAKLPERCVRCARQGN